MDGMTARNISPERKRNFTNNLKQLKPMSLIEVVAPIVVLIITLYLGRDLMKEED